MHLIITLFSTWAFNVKNHVKSVYSRVINNHNNLLWNNFVSGEATYQQKHVVTMKNPRQVVETPVFFPPRRPDVDLPTVRRWPLWRVIRGRAVFLLICTLFQRLKSKKKIINFFFWGGGFYSGFLFILNESVKNW